MADRGIIFSGSMVQALLAGRETQTRRLLTSARVFRTHERPAFTLKGEHLARSLQGASGFRHLGGDSWAWASDAFDYQAPVERTEWLAHIGHALGERLYVREAWSHVADGVFEIHHARMLGKGGVIYRCDENPKYPHAQFWPSIHMPREFSRLWLAVTDVRVQRLQEIGEADCLAEGIDHLATSHFGTPIKAYAGLWNSLHGADGTCWEDNPWVCATSFKVHPGNIDAEVTRG